MIFLKSPQSLDKSYIDILQRLKEIENVDFFTSRGTNLKYISKSIEELRFKIMALHSNKHQHLLTELKENIKQAGSKLQQLPIHNYWQFIGKQGVLVYSRRLLKVRE